MLDDQNVIAERDPHGALTVAADQYKQALAALKVEQPDQDGREIKNVVFAGMGGSALAALLIESWLKPKLTVPFVVVRDYNLPAYVDESSLVIASSYSGNTEETVSCLKQALERGSQVAVLAAGGQLLDMARQADTCFVELPSGLQPRMAVIYGLNASLRLLQHFDVTDQAPLDELNQAGKWLLTSTAMWRPEISVDKNLAKQIALQAAGKSAVFYAGSLMAPVAYKWKISWNETSKNLAFCNQYPEFNHNEFMGWDSHPVQKPYAVFDLMSRFEHPRIIKRFSISDRLLSGRRPKAQVIRLEGQTVLQQMLWASILADFSSIYLAIINGVNPVPVELIEKLKVELNRS